MAAKKVMGFKKRTCQGGKAKTSSMNKVQKRSYKAYRGQGR
jgi:hypothetical protein